jgi:apolipoprotein N-acyltransferase
VQITTDNGRRIKLQTPLGIDRESSASDGRLPAKVRYGLSLLSGLLMIACFPSLNWNLLVWFACTPLLIAVVTEPRLTQAFLLGYLSGAVFLTGSCYWFVIVMKRYGGLSTPLALGVLILFVIVFSVIFGLFGLAEAWVARHSRGMALAISPFLWVSLELLRTYYVTGFPWNLLGYGVQAAGLRQLASVTAVYGLTFLAVSTSTLIASAILLWRDRGFAMDSTAWRIWTTPALWFVLLAVINAMYQPPALPPGTNDVYLLQPNVPLDESVLRGWQPFGDRAPLHNLLDLSFEAACGDSKADTLGARPRDSACARGRLRSTASEALIVWAENPAPFFFGRDGVFRDAMKDLARRTGAYLVFNTVNFVGNDTTRPLNSAMVLDPGGEVVMQYDKIHLVPFGEYVPAWAFPGKVGKIVSEVSNFVPGTAYRSGQTPAGAIAVPICYEDIFPQLVRRLTPKGPGVLVSISNDAWYGDSGARYQHLEMASLRAIESGRYLLRATNDGVTSIIDPHGRVLETLPSHQAAVLSGHFSYLAGRTFYTAHGDVFALVCVLVTVAILASRIRETPRSAI